MRKGFVLGMIALASTVAISTAHGAVAAKAIHKGLESNSAKIHESLGKVVKNLDAANKEQVVATIKAESKLDATKATALAAALKGTAEISTADRIESASTLLAAKQSAAEIARTDKAEGDSIDKSADTFLQYLTNFNLVGIMEAKQANSSTVITASDLPAIRSGMAELVKMPKRLMMNFGTAERNVMVKIVDIYNKNAGVQKNGYAEEVFVKAVMEATGLSKEAAMEKIRQIKDCV